MIKCILKKSYKIFATPEYESWFETQTLKEQIQIDEPLLDIKLDGYFGDYKFLIDNIWELKWINGRRIYYAYLAELAIVLLLEGNKNGQNKDISKAKNNLKKYATKT